jgi:hypothetical protein
MGYSDNGQSFIILGSRRPFTKSVLEESVFPLQKSDPTVSLWGCWSWRQLKDEGSRMKYEEGSKKLMFTQLRVRYPTSSLVTELSAIDHGKYIVRCLVQVEGITLVTGLAAAETVELAEDQARSRALAVLGIDTTSEETETSIVPQEVAVPLQLKPTTSTTNSSDTLVHNQPTQFPEASQTSDTRSMSFVESRGEEFTASIAPTPWLADEISLTDELVQDQVETFYKFEDSPQKVEKVHPTGSHDVPVKSYSTSELETDPSGISTSSEPINFSDIIARTNVELKRLGWTNQQGRDYLVQTYGKRSRQLLTDDELLDFLNHLESEPSPE